MEKSPLRSAFILSLILIILAAGYRFIAPEPPLMTSGLAAVPTPQKEGSEHSHATMLIMVGDEIVDFCQPRFMLRNPLAHFEDNRCDTIHKHATGVTYGYFFTTIGVKIDISCLSLPSGKRYCHDAQRRVRVVLNGIEIPPARLWNIEIRNFDHLLVYYGHETGTALLFRYNQVPDVPLDVNPPKEQ